MPTPQASAQQRAALSAAMLTATLMIVQQIGGKTTRDAFFLSNHPASELPKVMIGAAVMSLLGALTYSRVLRSVGPARALPLAYLLHSALFMAEAWFAPRAPELLSVLVYLHMGALGPVVISGFWSLVNELFDPHTAKRYVGRVAASAALGGVVGGAAAERLIQTYELTAMFPALALVTLLAAMLAARVGAAVGESKASLPPPAGEARFRSTRYLRDLGAIVVVTSTMSGLLDFALKAEAAQEFNSPAALGSFFALFHAALSVLVFVLQSAVVGGSLRKLGIAGTIAMLPSGVLVGSVLSVAIPRLWTVALLAGLENLLKNSLFRSGYELLYTPIDKARKRAVKTIIDVGFDRLGDIAAAGLAMLCLALLPSESTRLVVACTVATAALGLLLALRLHRGYVDELAQSLRTGTLSVTDVKGLDRTTRQTLNDATLAIDRQQLLERIRELQAQKDDAEVPESQKAQQGSLNAEQLATLDNARILLLNDEQDVRLLLNKLLKASRLDSLLIPLMLPLLAKRHLARLVLSVLQKHCGGREGILIDALLNDELPNMVRRRIPRILRELGTWRARDGLLAALDDDNLGVRYYAAQALFRLVAKHPELAPKKERIFSLVDRETKVSAQEWSRPLTAAESDSLITGQAPQEPRRARVEYAFLLLGTVLDAEPLELCLKALTSGDPALRGTALEYLENVLPARLHTALARHLGGSHPRKRPKEERHATQIAEDLHQSMVNLRVDVDLYRKEPTGDEP